MAKSIDISDLDIYYGDFLAVEGVSLTIPARSVTAFIGPSGCGKSTFLRSLNRMHEVIPGARVEGKVVVDGQSLYDPGVDPVEVRRMIGMVFQRPNPFPTMSIYENVLAGDREPWLVIDPKPMAGDPHYEPAPMLWNRWEEVVASGNVRDAVRRRFFTLVDTAGLDEQRARDWVVVREVHNALWTVEDAIADGRGLDAEDHAWLTTAVTIAKAVQD